MISGIEPAGSKGRAPTYQLKVGLRGTQPPIWRKLQVPGDANLGWLHAVLQVAMGWTDSHRHRFKLGSDCYSDTRHPFSEFEGDPEILEERKFSLEQLAPSEKDCFGCECDFGDSWEHEITVAKILSPDAAAATTAPLPVRRRIAAASGATRNSSRRWQTRNTRSTRA